MEKPRSKAYPFYQPGKKSVRAETNCILQVEDEENDIFLLRAAFEKAGIRSPLVSVTDGQMAIDYLSGAGPYGDRNRFPFPCLVLLDLHLPKISGHEVLAWLRQQPSLRHVVVVVFSSSSYSEDVARAYELGANSYIEKPSGLQRTAEIAQLLKGWWLGFNQFAPIYERPATPAPQSNPS